MSFGLLRAVLITDPLIILTTVLMGSVSLLVSFVDNAGRRQLAVARAWSGMLLRIAGVSVRTEGLDNINETGSYIFAANHASYMDTPLVLAHIPVQFRFLAKESLFRIPFLGGHLRRAGHLPVPHENPRQAIRTMTEAARIVRERRVSLLIFPEGGRSLTGLQPFKEGAAYIAIKAGVPIVPVALLGTIDILPMHSVHMRSGTAVLRVGKPISTEGLSLRDRESLTGEVQARVAELFD